MGDPLFMIGASHNLNTPLKGFLRKESPLLPVNILKESMNMRITSDKKNFSKLLVNLAKAGYIKAEELFNNIVIREFHSDQYSRDNLVVEQSTTWENVEKSSEGGNPCISWKSWQSLTKMLAQAGKLHGVNTDAKDVKEAFDKLTIHLWTGSKNNQTMITVYLPSEETERVEPDEDTSMTYLTAPDEEPAEEIQVPPATAVVDTPAKPEIQQGATSTDDPPF